MKVLRMGLAEFLGKKKWGKIIIASTLIRKTKMARAKIMEEEEESKNAGERVFPNDSEYNIDRGRHT